MIGASVKVGVALVLTDLTPPVAEVAQAIEERGFESLWLGEHTHTPAQTTDRYTDDAPTMDNVARSLDPYVALAVAAAATTSLRVGTCISLPAEHATLALTKQVASLDLVA